MNNYTLLNNDVELNNIIDSINKVNEDYLLACHGRYHTTFVINTVEKILAGLKFDNEVIELGKIAALLHDIGTINGKKGHVHRSSEMCIKFLDKTNLSQASKNIIIHAIYDHSNGDDLNSPVGAALLLADKINLSKDRVLELGKSDNSLSNFLNVEETVLTVRNKDIIINYVANDKFSIEMFVKQWEKVINVSIKACDYLECNCVFQLNGINISF